MSETDLERIQRLRDKVGHVPQKPGIYIHKDASSAILYVGKAKNLPARLKSYFTGLDRHGPKTRVLVSKINDFEVILVDTESESLVLENNLIKHHRPPYNFLLRDDKTYPYLKISMTDPWPRVVYTRQRKNDGALYFGPFPSGAALHVITTLIHRAFPLIKCTPNVFKTVSRPCHYYEMGRCLGPCKMPVEPAVYKKHLDDVIKILNGKSTDVLRNLKKEMGLASDQLAFERAATIRDQIKALESLESTQHVALDPGLFIDFVGCAWHLEMAVFFVSQVRDGKLVGGQGFVYKRLVDDDNPNIDKVEAEKIYRSEALAAFMGQYYQRFDPPGAILVPVGAEIFNDHTRNLMQEYILNALPKLDKKVPRSLVVWSDKLPAKMKISKQSRDAISSLCNLANDNAYTRLQDELQVDTQSQQLMEGLQKFMNMSTLPAWLECYDISTFQGSDTVASGVVFKNGRPAKSEYRRYIIKETVGQDDFGSLREVIRRRFKEARRAEIPDCLVIDGGEPQVREVARVLESLGLSHICFFGLAKSRTERNFELKQISQSSERTVSPFRENGMVKPEMSPITKLLRIGSPEFRLLTQIRDEAHRFAITFHRQRRSKTQLKSILNSVPGLGQKRRKQLLTVFKSLDEVREKSSDEVAAATGIPVGIIESLKTKLADLESAKT